MCHRQPCGNRSPSTGCPHHELALHGAGELWPENPVTVVTPAASTAVIASASIVAEGYFQRILVVTLRDLAGNPVQADFQFAMYSA